VAEAPKRNGWLSLEMLQGTWLPVPNAPAQRRNCRISIHEEKLTLSVADSNGQVKILLSAKLKLCAADSRSTLLVSEADAEANSDIIVSI
jgi:hypothetical protein